MFGRLLEEYTIARQRRSGDKAQQEPLHSRRYTHRLVIWVTKATCLVSCVSDQSAYTTSISSAVVDSVIVGIKSSMKSPHHRCRVKTLREKFQSSSTTPIGYLARGVMLSPLIYCALQDIVDTINGVTLTSSSDMGEMV